MNHLVARPPFCLGPLEKDSQRSNINMRTGNPEFFIGAQL